MRKPCVGGAGETWDGAFSQQAPSPPPAPSTPYVSSFTFNPAVPSHCPSRSSPTAAGPPGNPPGTATCHHPHFSVLSSHEPPAPGSPPRPSAPLLACSRDGRLVALCCFNGRNFSRVPAEEQRPVLLEGATAATGSQGRRRGERGSPLLELNHRGVPPLAQGGRQQAQARTPKPTLFTTALKTQTHPRGVSR